MENDIEDWAPRQKIIPKQWVGIDFNEVFNVITTNGKKIKQKNYLDSGPLPVIDQGAQFIGGYTDDLTNQISVKRPVIVFGDHSRCFKLINFDFAPGADGTKVLSAHPEIDPIYLYYLCHTLELPNRGYSRHFSFLRKSVLPIAPINEQKRIVDKIEQLFSNIDEGEALLKQVQKQLATYRQSVLKAAVTGKLIGLDANEWPEQTIGQLLKDIRYGTAKKCLFDPSKTPVLRIPNVAGGKIDLSDLKHTDFTETELEKLRLEYGDLLLVRSNGSVSLVGLSAMVTKQAVGYAYAGYLIRLRLKQDIILPDFLNLYLHSPIVRGRIELQARSTSGVHNINSNEVKSISLRVPPLQHQEDTVSKVDDIFSQIDALENWCASELSRSATLRQSILKDAFSGKLVPQDPTDEPASELLKRIQAECTKLTKQKSSVPPRARGRRKTKESV